MELVIDDVVNRADGLVVVIGDDHLLKRPGAEAVSRREHVDVAGVAMDDRAGATALLAKHGDHRVVLEVELTVDDPRLGLPQAILGTGRRLHAAGIEGAGQCHTKAQATHPRHRAVEHTINSMA